MCYPNMGSAFFVNRSRPKGHGLFPLFLPRETHRNGENGPYEPDHRIFRRRIPFMRGDDMRHTRAYNLRAKRIFSSATRWPFAPPWFVRFPKPRHKSNRPGAHPSYSVELEPHGIIQWDVEPSNHTGFGLGLRASIPVVKSGPITTVNNSLAIAFGFDWAHAGSCHVGRVNYDDCSVDNFEVPVVVQWNFFFTVSSASWSSSGSTFVTRVGVGRQPRRR